MVAQNDGLAISDALHHAGLLFQVDGDAFEVVVRNPVEQLRAVERIMREAVFKTRNRTACRLFM